MHTHTPGSGMVTLNVSVEQARLLLGYLVGSLAAEFSGADPENPEEVLAAYQEAETLAEKFDDEDAADVRDAFEAEVPLIRQLLSAMPPEAVTH